MTKAPEIQVVPPVLIQWDQSQRKIIESSHDDRLLVGSGPGTGKTAVACARVSHLIDHYDLQPSRIWLISFTRTAVTEIRDRIAECLENEASAYAVKIATLDSHAWTIHSGFDEDAKIIGSYEENILKVLELVQNHENVVDYLETVEHLIVDEAQDIVGVRANLVIEMIKNLSSSCGVTVFADEAQAIYGFADDQEVKVGEVNEPPLLEKIRRNYAGQFSECELTTVHRTNSPNLLQIFTNVRRKVLTTSVNENNKTTEIKKDITEFAHGHSPEISDMTDSDLEDAFILYRRRCDVLLTSSYLTSYALSHRVRMSGLPVCIVPWVGAVLSEFTEQDLGQSRFMRLWDECQFDSVLASYDQDEAWVDLIHTAGRTHNVVDMHLLRQRLGRKRPPPEFCSTEFGSDGPIVGTIHASKGRESDTVHLIFPHVHGSDIDQDEEARVLFVGATRGRSRLFIGKGYRQVAKRVEATGRTYRLQIKNNKPYAQVEFGRDIDIDSEGLASRLFFASTDSVRISQKRILDLAKDPVSLVAESDRAANFAYRLKEDTKEEMQCIAVLSQKVNQDLFTVANDIQSALRCGAKRPPDKIRHLHVHGIRTIVLPPDAPQCNVLHEPWGTSGIMLAPLVLGYSKVYFPARRSKKKGKHA